VETPQAPPQDYLTKFLAAWGAILGGWQALTAWGRIGCRILAGCARVRVLTFPHFSTAISNHKISCLPCLP
jgi:hypothetical protein